MARQYGGTSEIATLLAPMTAPWPMVTPFMMWLAGLGDPFPPPRVGWRKFRGGGLERPRRAGNPYLAFQAAPILEPLGACWAIRSSSAFLYSAGSELHNLPKNP